MNKKQLYLWSLYDFANSVVYINFALYFSQWIVVDAKLPDFWYNAIFAITTIMLLFTAPTLAARTDIRGGRKFWLNISTIGTFVFYGLTAICATKDAHVLLVALMFLIGQYFYQLSFVFYNPMLDDIADEAHKSRASGIGNLASSLGFVAGILITLPFAHSRITPLLVSTVGFFALALPAMVFLNENKKQAEQAGSASPLSFAKKLIIFFMTSAAAPVLTAFFFFNDTLLTISNNFSIYLERVFHVPDTNKSILLLILLAMSAIGSAIAGWLGDKIGALKTLKLILIGWIILLPMLSLAPNFKTASVLSPFLGLFIGSVWTVARAHLAMVLPKKDLGYGFSFYTIMERFATLVGPLAWGGIIWGMGTTPLSYRTAVASMTAFIIIGLAILHYWKRPFLIENKPL